MQRVMGQYGLTEEQAFEYCSVRVPALREAGGVVINTRVARPLDVPFLLKHEAALHDGIRKAFGDKAANELFDLTWKSLSENENMQQILKDYQIRQAELDAEGNAVLDEDGNPVYRELTREEQREAAEELLAKLGETNGVPLPEIYQDHRAEIDAWGRQNGFDTRDLTRKEDLVKGWMAETGFQPERPSWLTRLISSIRIWLNRHGWFVHHLSDDDILTILAKSAGAVSAKRKGSKVESPKSKAGDVRYALFDNPAKSTPVIDVLQKIADGSEEETVPGLRNDLEQYGGTNDITFLWGDDKKGIYHIAYRRGLDTLLHVIDAVSDGEITKFVSEKKTVHIEKDGYEAILSLDEHGKKKSWLLTGWEIDKPDAIGEVSAHSDATQFKPTFSRQELGAGLYNIIHGLSGKSSKNSNNTRFSISPEQDTEYLNAVKRGDMETARAMVRKAAENAGYSANSDYQGSLAFNGAAPSKNGYYDTKEERKAAWEAGEYEGEFSLGDYMDNGIDTHDLEWRINDPAARYNEPENVVEAINNLRNTVKSGKRTIKIYRAVDSAIKESQIRNGDWVTPSRSYAEYHIELQDWERGRIIEQEVSVDDLLYCLPGFARAL